MTCPDVTTLDLLVNDQLQGPDLDATVAHVEQCPTCQTWLEGRVLGPEGLEPAPGQQDRYRILRLHARGGLGEVFIAQDTELNRPVALKRMQERCRDDPDSRRRFLQETEITARLEHPGVVPVYGLVQDTDGHPCYAMRFIHGESLAEAIGRFHEADQGARAPGERRLALRELLGRFVAVCNAVAYAHSRGILHRDLKPGNVMLGQYGETLVVDWGLAKPVARGDTAPAEGEPTLTPASADGDSATRTGQALGTPSFMSPEQAAGQWDAVGPASDVYSLGAILYTILTGRAPVAGTDVRDKLEKVKRGDFPRPGTVKPCAPALEAVCLKALALRPEERYPTALALAAEVEHWLADEPVEAWPEPWRVRAWRRVRRHPGRATGAVAAVLLAAVVTAAVGLVQAAREREQQATAHAQESFGLALRTSDELVGLARSLKPVPGTRIGSLRQLLTLADKNYAGMLNQARGSRGLLERAGRLLNDLSELYADLGDTRKALQQGREARAIFEDLLKQDAANVAWQRGLAVSLDRIAVATWRQGDAEQSLATARRALAVRRGIPPLTSGGLDGQVELAANLNLIGVLLADEGDMAGALAAYQESFHVAEALARRHPTSPPARNRLGVSLVKIAGARDRQKLRDLPRALATYEKAVALYRDLVRDDPNNLEWSRMLLDALGWAGDVHKAQGDLTSARNCYEESMEIAARLARWDPENQARQRDVVLARRQLADLKKTGDLAEETRRALAGYRELHALEEQTVKRDPHNGMARSHLAELKANIAGNLAELVRRGRGRPQDLDEARALLREGFAVNEELRKRYPTRRLFVSGFNDLCLSQGMVLQAEKKMTEGWAAVARGRQAQVDFFRNRAEREPDNPAWQEQLAQWSLQLAEALSKQKKQAAAAAARRQAIAAYERLVALQPDNADWRQGLARARAALK